MIPLPAIPSTRIAGRADPGELTLTNVAMTRHALAYLPPIRQTPANRPSTTGYSAWYLRVSKFLRLW